MDLPPDLRTALDQALAGVGVRAAAETVGRLIERYRTGGVPDGAILSTEDDVLAYAGYRMPATYAAVRAALAQLGFARPDLAPASLVDLGGGTGAAAWAAVEQFPGLATVTVLDRAEPALALGRRLAERSRLHRAVWREARLDPVDVDPAELVTVSYVLGELPEAERAALIARAAAAARILVVVEPGTPAGYARILAARDGLIAAGLTVVAPCPHQDACPIVPGRDWCHFSARVNRSSVHRRLKGGELGYEDEKFSYVAGVRDGSNPGTGRVLRRPELRKGMVTLQVCTPRDGIARSIVSKRQGERYRAARDAAWGDPWPSPAQPPHARRVET